MGKVSELRRLTVSIDKTAQTLLLKLDFFFIYLISKNFSIYTLYSVLYLCCYQRLFLFLAAACCFSY